MSYAIGEYFESFIKAQLETGRYNNASEIVREGLRLVEEREARLQALSQHLERAIAKGGAYSDEELAAQLDAEADLPE